MTDIIHGPGIMAEKVAELRDFARHSMPILITGETGTGKTLAAHYAHKHSTRANGPFEVVDSTHLGSPNAKADLFGVAARAYTEVAARPGKVQLAHQGTLFFDEIGDLSLEMQAQLLTFLADKKFSQSGRAATEIADVRFIFGTNVDLKRAVHEKRFREDLFRRIEAVKIHLPALRERRNDIPILVNHLCKTINENSPDLPLIRVEALAMQRLCDYAWPGNVRELGNRLYELAVRSQAGVIDEPLVQRVLWHAEEAEPIKSSPGHFVGQPAPSTQFLERPELVEKITDHLTGERLAVLLTPRRGGGTVLARQLAAELDPSGESLIWLQNTATMQSPEYAFFRNLANGAAQVTNQPSFREWLQENLRPNGIIVLDGVRGPVQHMENLASTLLDLHAQHKLKPYIVVIGGQYLLSLIGQQHLLGLNGHSLDFHLYFLHKLFDPAYYFDIPFFSEKQIAELAILRNVSARLAPMLTSVTSGHPGLLHILLDKASPIYDKAEACKTIFDYLARTPEFKQHMANLDSRAILQDLLKQERSGVINGQVRSLAEHLVRHDPEKYAESRLYYDRFLTWDQNGTTRFISPAVADLVRRSLS